jgi:hypothetical protein
MIASTTKLPLAALIGEFSPRMLEARKADHIRLFQVPLEKIV